MRGAATDRARRRTAYVEVDRFYAGLAERTIDAVESRRFPTRRAARRAKATAEATLVALALARGHLRNTWLNVWKAPSWN